MKAYISSNPERQAQLDAQRHAITGQFEDAKRRLAAATAKPEIKAIKAEIKKLEAALQELTPQYPAMLFSEAGALQDLEDRLTDAAGNWEEKKAAWLKNAEVNPAYAIERGSSIVEEQQIYEVAYRLQQIWQHLSETEGRSLVTFRKAYDEVAEWRKNKMMNYLTGGRSSCAFSNAVEHQRGRALAQQTEYRDHILSYLLWYEKDAEKMTHVVA